MQKPKDVCSVKRVFFPLKLFGLKREREKLDQIASGDEQLGGDIAFEGILNI
jgi:hypothetical protein